MKPLIIVVTLLSLSATAFADQYVRGYVRKDGTYVQPHYRSSPNSSTYDNYSTRGNVNPYTGQRGYESPYPSMRPSPTIEPLRPLRFDND